MNINNILNRISGFIWGEGLIFLLLFAGVVYTFRLKFIQFRVMPFLIKSIRTEKDRDGKGISQLKTVCMSLGTAMGTGNITGVAAALMIGGAGAIFWMWVSAFFGMAVVYSENYLAKLYGRDGCTGTMAYLEYGLGSKILSTIFAFCCVCAALGMGGMVQVSSFGSSLSEYAEFNHIAAALIVFILVYAVISGGTDRIGTAAQTLLPLVTAVYTVAAFIIIAVYIKRIPHVFAEIFSEAIGFDKALGGISGYKLSRTVSVGIRRGIFSNEAGLGSSPILHGAADNNSPEVQGMWSAFEVFFDTIICCTLTAVVILVSSDGGICTVSAAFNRLFGAWTDYFLTAAMGIFAFCTIIGWYYCGETAYIYLFGNNHRRGFSLTFAVMSALGMIISPETVWILSDIFNGIMAFSNLPGLILLMNKVRRE
jgi:AGCS family alanine or glycine:cation symporter